MRDNALMWPAIFITIYVFRDINSVILQHLYLTQLICTYMHLQKLVGNICYHHWKQIEQLLLCHANLVFSSEVSSNVIYTYKHKYDSCVRATRSGYIVCIPTGRLLCATLMPNLTWLILQNARDHCLWAASLSLGNERYTCYMWCL